MENNQTNNPNNQENSSTDQGNLGTAGSEGTEAYNNGNEGTNDSERGKEESGSFDKKADDYEGGNLGTAGSGGEEIKNSENRENMGYDRNNHLTNSDEDQQKVLVPTLRDDYEGGNMGTSGSGSMDMHGSESSLTLNALSPENTDEKTTNSNSESKNKQGLGSPPLGDIADGSRGGRQTA